MVFFVTRLMNLLVMMEKENCFFFFKSKWSYNIESLKGHASNKFSFSDKILYYYICHVLIKVHVTKYVILIQIN